MFVVILLGVGGRLRRFYRTYLQFKSKCKYLLKFGKFKAEN